MKKLSKLLGTIVLAMASAAFAQTTTTLIPSGDAYVRGGSAADNNYGGNVLLGVRTANNALNTYWSYINFDTSGLSGQVISAKLRLFTALGSSGSVQSNLYATGTAWGETTITWNNKPTLGTQLGTITVDNTSYVWFEVDVTSYVQSQQGQPAVAFALANPAVSSQLVAIQSRESSTPSQLVVVTNTVPAVSITAPAGGTVFTAPASITVSANATDADGTVTQVQFFANATPIGTDTTAPYSVDWTSVAAGTYNLTAVATDNVGATTTSAAVPVVVNAPPTVSITSPTSNATFNAPANITISATAADADGTVAQVQFFANGAPIGTDTTAPYSVDWTNVTAGSYSLTAVVTDNLGATTTSAAVPIIVNGAPSVSITSPTSGTVLQAPGNVSLTATATDSDGTIAKVEFYRDGTLIATDTATPYEANDSALAAGTYSYTAVATDNLGATTTSTPVSVTVNAAPAVSITSPADNATFNAPATITITASAQDTDGSINRVELYANNTLIATLTTAPYSFDWTNVAVGTYALTAKAVDNNNGETISAPVSITVRTVSTLYFIEVDHLNTPRLVANDQGQTVWRWDNQEPFGGSVPDENPSGLGLFEFPLAFEGQYRDKETGLHYNYFRDYDPSLGRYGESDPVGLKGGPNTYAYVDLRPLNYSDRSGLLASEIVRSWPVNGNLYPGFERQDKACSPPADALNNNPCYRNCCAAHDECYTQFNCNWTSWAYMPIPIITMSPCGRCNKAVVDCIGIATIKGCNSCAR